MHSRDDPRVSNCRGTRHHAPIDRPTGATPCVPPKHVIVATIQPSWSPRWRNIPVHGGATTVTMTPRSRGWPTGNNPRRRRDSGRGNTWFMFVDSKNHSIPTHQPCYADPSVNWLLSYQPTYASTRVSHDYRPTLLRGDRSV